MKKVFAVIASIACLPFMNIAGNGFTPPKASNSDILKFEENKGQWHPNVKYKAKMNGIDMYLENNAFTYMLYNVADGHKEHGKGDTKTAAKYHAYQVVFDGAANAPAITSNNQLSYYHNYFLGNNSKYWATNVHLYESVTYNDLYKGIDMNVYSYSGHMKYDFVVAPGADYKQIKLNYVKANKIFVDERGDLNINTSLGTMKELKPVVYQIIDGQKKYIKANYVIRNSGNSVYFNIEDNYNTSLPLIIDPTLVASTYTGSNADNWGFTATYDDNGDMYAGGIAFSVGYPVTLGAFDSSFNGGGTFLVYYPGDIQNPAGIYNSTGQEHDAVISKFNSTGTQLIYSTYIGGIDNEQPHSMVVDANGELVIMGRTKSLDFPVSATGYDQTYNGNTDIFVLRLNSAGTALIGSTYIGGAGDDGINMSRVVNYEFSELRYNYGDDSRSEVILDTIGNIYVASCTKSADFPVTAGVFKNTLSGTQDGCVLKLSNDLSALTWSSFFGGTRNDACYALAVDKDLNIYVTGGTTSDSIATTGALDTTYGGLVDGFVAFIKSDASQIISSSYLGTTAYDQSFFIQLDGQGDVYVTGQTKGAYPVTGGVYSNAGSANFVHKLDSSLKISVWSSVFGNGSANPNLSPTAFLVDDCGRIYVSGWGGALTGNYGYPEGNQIPISGMPVSANAYKSTTDNGDFYLIAFENNMTALAYASYMGSTNTTADHVDGGTSRFDKKGIVYQAVCAGCGANNTFPTTPSAWSATNGSNNCNLAIFKFDFRLKDVEAKVTASTNASCAPAPYPVTFTNTSNGAVDFSWDYGDGTPLDTTNFSPVHTYTANGTYTVTLIVADPNSCNKADTSKMLIEIKPAPSVNIGNDTTVCDINNLVLSAGATGTSYTWSTGSTNQSISINQAGSYWVRVVDGVCITYDTITVNLVPLNLNLGTDKDLCTTPNLTLDAGNVGSTYSWSTGSTAQTINVTSAGTYYVDVDNQGCKASDTVKVTIHAIPVVDIGNDTTMCGAPNMVLNAGNTGSTYSWSTGASTQQITVTSGGNYIVTVSNGFCSQKDTVIIIEKPYPTVGLGADTVMCDDPSTLLLNAGAGSGNTYSWSTGATTQGITVSSTGVYGVIVNKNGCQTADTINISYLKEPVVQDTVICSNASLTLNVAGSSQTGITYSWSNGSTTTSTTVSDSGDYYVFISKGGCLLVDSFSVQELPSLDDVIVPNVFTPNNGDLVNNYFDITAGGKYNIGTFDLKVYDRWGVLMYETNDVQSPWDGKHKNKDAPAGVYYYILMAEDACKNTTVEKHGHVQIIR